MVAATDFVTKLNAAIEAVQSVPDIISADTTKVLNYYPNIPCNDVTDLVDQIDEKNVHICKPVMKEQKLMINIIMYHFTALPH